MENELDMIEFEKLDEEIERLLDNMSGYDPTSDEYKLLVSHLSALMKTQETLSKINKEIFEAETKLMETEARIKLNEIEGQLKIKESDNPRRVSPDTWAIVAANLVGIGLILGHERLNVITTKALGFIMRMR